MKDSFEVLISSSSIQARIQTLAERINEDYQGKSVTCVGVLKGSFLFMADLVRHLDIDVCCDFLGVSSYKGTESTGQVRITHDLREPVEGRHVLIVEDIVDTGLTLDYLLHNIGVRKPASIAVASLLDKPSRRQVQVQVDYVGFSIPDAFVVGFGLDLDERFRQWPDIRIYKPQ